MNIRQVDTNIRNMRVQNNIVALIAFINALLDNNFDKTVLITVPSNLIMVENIKYRKRIFIS